MSGPQLADCGGAQKNSAANVINWEKCSLATPFLWLSELLKSLTMLRSVDPWEDLYYLFALGANPVMPALVLDKLRTRWSPFRHISAAILAPLASFDTLS